jgi:hypothetical protein
MQPARFLHEKYYNSKAKKRANAVQACCLLHFKATDKGAYQKMVRRWK